MSREGGHAHTKAGETILVNNDGGELATAGVLAGFEARPEQPVHVHESH